MGSVGNSNPWAPYHTYKDCSQEICSIYCPQWCYIIFPPPPPFGIGDEYDDHDSGTDFSPLIIAVIGILASAFILLTYYTIISKYCRRRGNNIDGRATDMDHDTANQTNDESWGSAPPSSSAGLDESLIKSITVYKYKIGDTFIEGTDCSVCLSEFEENESLRLLPKCNHAFHVPCIDTWLKSHSSCPLCRSNINIANAQAQNSAGSGAQQTQQQQQQQQQQDLNISALEHQHRSNETFLVVVQDLDLERGGEEEEEVINLPGEGLPKTPCTGGPREIESRPIRRSFSLNSSNSFCQGRVLVADILRATEEDEEIVIHMENVQSSMEIGSSKAGVDQEEHCKSNDTSVGRSPLEMKRSISTGRFMLTRYGKPNNSILPN
ncbi:hypothetical protein FNV43_RR12764 [Rhamnella rubrinervis]|uniref:RING-type E3 ubiquitin transferase n=1 Tax=Rhamnella rubrinervis TaxID=2594499 RepID=A0A8K0MIY1_9ROSA|nr:hypothetical protein FNV43_RR12764 [Rhamnella rubrinervis]